MGPERAGEAETVSKQAMEREWWHSIKIENSCILSLSVTWVNHFLFSLMLVLVAYLSLSTEVYRLTVYFASLGKASLTPKPDLGTLIIFSYLPWTLSKHCLIFHFIHKVDSSHWRSFLEFPDRKLALDLALHSNPQWCVPPYAPLLRKPSVPTPSTYSSPTQSFYTWTSQWCLLAPRDCFTWA